MRAHTPFRVTAALASLLTSATAVAQAQGATVATITLDRGAKEFTESFSQIGALIELRDGRLLVVDTKEKSIHLVDLTRGTRTPVSRTGGGPLEYQVPGLLLNGPADTVAYYDMMQRRFLLFSPSGSPLRTVSSGGADMSAMLTQMQPTSADTMGRIYGQTMGMSMPARGSTPMPNFADTVEIQSRDLRTGRVTTLTRIRNVIAQVQPKMEMAGGSIKLSLTAPNFGASDAWTVLPDGRVAILRDGVYRVHFLAADGPDIKGPIKALSPVPVNEAEGRPASRSETLGPLVPFTPVPVTETEKREVVDSLRKELDRGMKAMREATAGMASARGVSGAAMPKIDAVVVEPSKWAATKPPYTGLRSSPDGRLWVAVSLPANTKTARFDILDGKGAVTGRVQFAAGEQLAGLGRGAVYTIRTDADDLQYLRRYTLPKLPWDSRRARLTPSVSPPAPACEEDARA